MEKALPLAAPGAQGQSCSHCFHSPRAGCQVDHEHVRELREAVRQSPDNVPLRRALATALLVLGPEEGARVAERMGLRALFLIRGDDGGIDERTTAGFEDLIVQSTN